MKQVYYTVDQFKLTPIANEILFQKRIKNLFEELFQSYNVLLEEETGEPLNPEEKKAMDTLMKSVVDAVKGEKSNVLAIAGDEAKIDNLEKKYPELGKLEDKLKEANLNEFVLTATLVAGLLAAIPALIKIFGWLVKGVGSLLGKMGFQKAGEKTKQFAEKIMHASHDVHDAYIGMIDDALVYLVPDYKDLPQAKRKKIAEVVYMIIIFSLGLSAGVSAFHSFSAAHWVPGGVEGALSAIKSGEIGVWLSDTIAAAVETA